MSGEVANLQEKEEKRFEIVVEVNRRKGERERGKLSVNGSTNGSLGACLDTKEEEGRRGGRDLSNELVIFWNPSLLSFCKIFIDQLHTLCQH